MVPGDFRKRGFASRDDPRISFQRKLNGCFRNANNFDFMRENKVIFIGDRVIN